MSYNFSEEDLRQVLITEIKKNIKNEIGDQTKQTYYGEDYFKVTVKNGGKMQIMQRSISNGKIDIRHRSANLDVYNMLSP